jgi:biotin carboxylase
MATVLILYPGSVTFRQEQMARHRPMLRELGIRTVLADDFVQDSDLELFDEVVELPPCDRVVEGWRVLERWLDDRSVDAVLAQSESAILLGALATKKIGRPGITPRSALLCVSKVLCRRELERARVPQPRFALARSARDVREFAAENGYPLVLKATASALGRLVTFVESASEVDGAVERVRAGLPESTDVLRLAAFATASGIDLGYDPRAEFLVEAFAPGEPVETDGIVAGRKPRTFGVTGQILTKPPFFFVEGYLLPADRPQSEIDEIERVSDAAIAALAVTDTGYSIEMRLHAGRPQVIEVNGRLGWDEGFGDLFEVVTGVQPAFLCLQVALGVRPEFLQRADVRCALAYRSTYSDGVVRGLPTRAELDAIEASGVRAGLAVHADEETFAPPHPDATPHLGWVLATHPSSSRAAYDRARTWVDRMRFHIDGGAKSPTPHL